VTATQDLEELEETARALKIQIHQILEGIQKSNENLNDILIEYESVLNKIEDSRSNSESIKMLDVSGQKL